MYEGCCCDSGNVRAHLRLQKSGYVSGEPLYYDLVVHNKATSTICGIALQLIQVIILRLILADIYKHLVHKHLIYNSTLTLQTSFLYNHCILNSILLL